MGIDDGSSGQDYRPVRRIGWRWYSPYRLYESDQQLLTINTGIATEQYRRIAFPDICGFSIADSARYAAFNVIGIIAAVIFMLIAAVDDLEGVVAPILAGVALLFLVANLVKGKSCRCVVSTAYTHVRLRAITRERAAQRFKTFLLERVEAAQGRLSPEEVATRLQPEGKAEGGGDPEVESGAPAADQAGAAPEPPDASVPSQAGEAASEAPPPPIGRRGKAGCAEQWAALLLTLLGLFSFLHLLAPGYPLAITGLVFVASLLVSIVALANVRRPWLKVSVACHGAVCVLGYILNIYLQVESSAQNQGVFAVGWTAEADDPLVVASLVANGVWALGVALYGWQQISKAKRGGRG